jgi:hypothetical protein
MRDVDIKTVYNTFLRISRQQQNKPYRLKSDWSDFENSKNYLPVIKLKSFFDRNVSVNIEDFFKSPYYVYDENTYYDIDFYNTLSAIKVYGIFCNKINLMDPDNELQINNILRGVKFIREFCKIKNLKLGEYLTYIERDNVINSFILHLKEKKISVFNLFPLKNFDRIISGIDFDILKFILNELPIRLSILRGKFYASKKGKQIAIEGLKIIEKDLLKRT